MQIDVLGFGGYVPERVMTNDDWAVILDTSDEWIRSRTGIRERRIAADHESTLDLAEHAAMAALADAGLSPSDLSEIIVATDTPEVYTPDTAAHLQHRLGAEQVPAFDLGGSGCAGFVQALDVARSRVAFAPKTVLVVGVELISRMIDRGDRNTAVLFGDGAGAVIVGPAPGRAEILDVVAGTDGSRADILTLQAGGTRRPFSMDVARAGEHQHLEMAGREVFVEAVKRMSASVVDVLERIGCTIDDVSLVVPHQANLRIIDAIGGRLGLDPDRMYVNIDRYGNTGSATVPLALSEAVAGGRISSGDLVVLTAFGAGFHWASAALRF